MNGSGDDAVLIVFVVFIILILFAGIGGGCYCYRNNETFTSKIESAIQQSKLYNPLYVSPELNQFGSYIYTEPPGNVKAQEYAGSGQGTKGEFFPLQGIGAGQFLANSANSNLMLPTNNSGKIGGYGNYTKQPFSTAWIGFNNFGAPFQLNPNSYEISNSYTLSGTNERVCNSGQKCDNLKAQEWWPQIQKGEHGFAVQGSDAMVECKSINEHGEPNRTIETCKGQGAMRFLANKFNPQWKHVVEAKK